ncbi:MFS transporter [Fimbriimonas ginsengisoli]|uniref:Major facilitator superfamily MFS_1 n=1 Tax=Fimbriimonas ginsengisoli Gsoil 348 TaxID=661478 RepID=A0A068NVQ2_FIMGI|nr:MFS transporter [Fimbriimonas ginsengisoli]AIE87521.1 major facilitator superfamily MFS_1 [Fimbriimonas ginsengisoli Gsoil 348]
MSLSLQPKDPVQIEAAEIPAVPSPYETISAFQHVKLSAYWFATNFLWGALLLVMLPGEVQTMNPEFRAKALGLLTGVSALVALVVPLIVGALSDRCGSRWGRRRPYMATGLVINIVGLVTMAASYAASVPTKGATSVWDSMFHNPGFLFFSLGYLIVQFGNNVASAAYMGVIPDVVPQDQRGVASGYMALMSQLGSLFGAIGCGLLLKSAPESAKYATLSIVLVAVALVTILGMRENPLPFKPQKINWVHYVRSLWIDPRAYPDFAWVWITRALVMLGFYAVVPFINYYLVDVINISQKDVGGRAAIIQAIILITSTISGFLGGKWSDKVGRKKVVYVANMLIAVMALAFIFCRSMQDVIIAGSLFGLGYGAYISVDYALGTDVLPSRKDAGKEMAVWHIAMTLPQSFAAPIAGYLIEIPGKKVLPPLEPGGENIVHYATAGYSYVFTLCAVCFALGALLLRNVRGVK